MPNRLTLVPIQRLQIAEGIRDKPLRTDQPDPIPSAPLS